MNSDHRTIARREFLGHGLLASPGVVGLGPLMSGNRMNTPIPSLPTRKLGKTGIEVTILSQEASQSSESLDRILRFAYSNGVRSFDTADCYASSEQSIARWMRAVAGVRERIFLVTKDHPRIPSRMMGMLDQRLAALRLDRVDLFLIHGLGNHHALDEAIALVTSRDFKTATEAIKKAGKAKFVGFSTEHKDRAHIVEAASEAGFVDAILLQRAAWLAKDDPLNRALDAAYERGIGLIAMKPMAGLDPKKLLTEVSRRMPWLPEKGLSPFQGLLHAIWSDERISSCSLPMRNTVQIRESTDAARTFDPLAQP